MNAETSPDEYLGRLLLLQNVAALLPYRGLDNFVCQGLSDFPGVTSVHWAPDKVSHHVKATHLQLPLKYGESNFGTICLQVSDRKLISPYVSYLNNFAATMAVLLETKRKEKSARTVQDRFFELAPDLLCVSDTKGYFTKLSYSWEKTLGRSRTELCAQPFLQFIHPDDLTRTNEALNNLNMGENVFYFSNRYQHKNGSYRWLEWICSPEDDNTIFGVARDITESRSIQQKLELAASVFNTTNDAILVCNQKGEILSANHSFTQVTGYSSTEIIGKNISLLKDSKSQDERLFVEIRKTFDRTGEWKGELWIRHYDGNSFLCLTTIKRIAQETTELLQEHNFVFVMRDITEQRGYEKRIQELAYNDPLTGLANRMLLLDRLDHAISKAARNNKKIAVIYIDLDNFKSLNDSLGHDVGDSVLKIQAKRLLNYMRKSDTVARTSGDEFVIVVESIANIDLITALVTKVLQTLSEPIVIEDQEFRSTASIGVSVYPDDGEDRVLLMKNADAAVYHAKHLGRNTFRFFSSEMTEKANEKLKLETELRNAIENEEFEIYYQPKVCLRSYEIIGAEALIRWNHPALGLLLPGSFIPFAEESNLIKDIGLFVIKAVIKQIGDWQRQTNYRAPIAINLSASQFAEGDICEIIRDTCDQHQVPTQLLEVEVTESVIMNNPEQAAVTLKKLRELGICIAIDDFGTGHSSLAYLKKLPLDVLKIDREFVKDIHQDEEDLEISKAIIALSKALDLSVVAEGVELDSHAAILSNWGVDYAQGYLFSKPLPATTFIDYFNASNQSINAKNNTGSLPDIQASSFKNPSL